MENISHKNNKFYTSGNLFPLVLFIIILFFTLQNILIPQYKRLYLSHNVIII
jgi:hypothetical protein